MPSAPSAPSSDRQTFSLAAELNVRDAVELKHELDALLSVRGALELDASAVERVDACSLQLLAAFVRARRERMASCHVVRPSKCFERGLSVLGLAEHLLANSAEPTSSR